MNIYEKAEESNSPPFDVVVPKGVSPEDYAKDLVSGKIAIPSKSILSKPVNIYDLTRFKPSKNVLRKLASVEKFGIYDSPGIHKRELSWRQGTKEDRYPQIIAGPKEAEKRLKQNIVRLDTLSKKRKTPKIVKEHNELLSIVRRQAFNLEKYPEGVAEYPETLLQKGVKSVGLDKTFGMDIETANKRRRQLERARAEVQKVGGRVEGPRLLEQGARAFTNSFLAHIPEAIAGAIGETYYEPKTIGEKIVAGAGDLLGFVIGAPGKITSGVFRAIEKIAPWTVIKGSEKLAERVVKSAAKEVPALATGFASSAIGEAMSQGSVKDALSVLYDRTKAGATMGATFAGVRGISPKPTVIGLLTRLATGITLLDLQNQTAPWDERDLKQKVFDYGTDIFFLWYGLPEAKRDLILKEWESRTEEGISNTEIRKRWREGTAEEREELLKEVNRVGVKATIPTEDVQIEPEVKAAEPTAAVEEFEFVSKKGNRYTKTNDIWYNAKGNKVSNPYQLRALEKGKVIVVPRPVTEVKIEEPIVKAEEPIIEEVPLQGTKKGKPFSTESWAKRAAIKAGIPIEKFEVVPVEGGFRYREIKRIFREEPVVEKPEPSPIIPVDEMLDMSPEVIREEKIVNKEEPLEHPLRIAPVPKPAIVKEVTKVLPLTKEEKFTLNRMGYFVKDINKMPPEEGREFIRKRDEILKAEPITEEKSVEELTTVSPGAMSVDKREGISNSEFESLLNKSKADHKNMIEGKPRDPLTNVERKVLSTELGRRIEPSTRSKEDIQGEIDQLKLDLEEHRKDLTDNTGDADTQAGIRDEIRNVKAEIADLNKELKTQPKLSAPAILKAESMAAEKAKIQRKPVNLTTFKGDKSELSVNIEVTAEELEKILADEGMPSELESLEELIEREQTELDLEEGEIGLRSHLKDEGDGSYTLDSLGFQQIYEAGAKILKRSPTAQNVNRIGRAVYLQGYRKLGEFTKKIREISGESWDKAKKFVSRAWLAAKKFNKMIGERGSITLAEFDPTKGLINSVLKDIRKLADEYLGEISTRLGNIDPSLKHTLRRFEFYRGTKFTNRVDRILPLIKATEKMTKEDRSSFDIARKNGDPVELKRIVTKYKIGKEYHEQRLLHTEIEKEARDVGYKFKHIPNHHPREVKNASGLLDYLYKTDDWTTFDYIIKKKEAELKRYLTDDEKIKVINSLLRGYSSGEIKLSIPGQVKARTIKTITPEIDKFYADSNSALIRYISDMTDAIEARKIFGKGTKKQASIDLNNTIGSYVLKLLKERRIKPSEEREITRILKARFNAVSTSGVISLYKNASYIDTMGSPVSAIRQIGDIAWSLYETGLIRTTKSVGKVVVGYAPFTKKDLGIERIAAEFSDMSAISKAVDVIFNTIGLTKIDAIGKEVLISSVYDKISNQAKTTKGKIELRKEFKPIFEGETEQLIQDLENSKVTENVKLYLFNKLSDMQPISLSEVPEKYLVGGNGRIFYMLKTFTLKAFDIFRRECFQKISTKGERLQGLRNLIRLTAYFSVMNASADMIQDLLLGRPTELSDLVVENIYRLFGASRYTAYGISRKGLGTTLAEQILPPFKAINAISQDIKTFGDEKGFEITQSIPVVGKLYYWWFGKGAKKLERKQHKERLKGSLRTPGSLRK